jgi:hypothetical protein
VVFFARPVHVETPRRIFFAAATTATAVRHRWWLGEGVDSFRERGLVPFLADEDAPTIRSRHYSTAPFSTRRALASFYQQHHQQRLERHLEKLAANYFYCSAPAATRNTY